MTKKKCIIVDVDGTIADHTDIRGHHEYDKVSMDKPVLSTIELLSDVTAANPREILFVTGRPNIHSVRDDTIKWINENLPYVSNALAVNFGGVNLFMRKAYLADGDRDFRPDYIIKEEIYNDHIKDYYEVDFCLDDRNQTVDGWRRLGLTCFQVAEGAF